MADRQPKEAVYSPILRFTDWHPLSSSELQNFKPRIEKLKDRSPDLFVQAATEAMKWASIETGAIEDLYKTDRGFTFSVASQTNTLQIVLDRKGESFAQHLKAQLNAYEYILDFATGKQELALSRVRELHAVVCEGQDTYKVLVAESEFEERPLSKGVFKKFPNNVATATGIIHHYCPVEDVNQQMQFLVDQTRDDVFLNAPAIVQGSYVHHTFTQIHPFSDGNGRMARALASIYLYRELSIPMVIFNDQRDVYFNALEAADSRNTEEFQKFMETIVDSTIEMLEVNVQGAHLQTPNEQKEVLINALQFGTNMTPSDLLKLVNVLAKLLNEGLSSKKSEFIQGWEDHVTISTNISIGSNLFQRDTTPAGHVDSGCGLTVSVSINDAPNPIAPVQHEYRIIIPEKSSEINYLSVFRAHHTNEFEESVKFRIDELTDPVSASTSYKVNRWCSNALGELINAAIKAAKK